MIQVTPVRPIVQSFERMLGKTGAMGCRNPQNTLYWQLITTGKLWLDKAASNEIFLVSLARLIHTLRLSRRQLSLQPREPIARLLEPRLSVGERRSGCRRSSGLPARSSRCSTGRGVGRIRAWMPPSLEDMTDAELLVIANGADEKPTSVN